MQIFEKPEAVIVSYPFRSLGNPDDFLFFDIETTGLGAGNARVYLIGALTHSAPIMDLSLKNLRPTEDCLCFTDQNMTKTERKFFAK